MELRRIFAVYALTIGLSLLALGSSTSPAAVTTPDEPPGEQLQQVGTPARPTEPGTVAALAAPKRRTAPSQDLGRYDIPVTALLAYQQAADVMAAVKPSCDLSWTLLAAIGRVESNHGRHAGAALTPEGVSSPQILGVALDGKGPVAAISDTDRGRWDGDATWDHAVGPMQFLPSTWSLVGVDADGDGVRSIDDVDDAALAAGVYLCAGPEGSLKSSAAMEQALRRYNDSDDYVALVMAYEAKYRGGDFEVLTPSGGVAESTAVLVSHPLTGTPVEPDGKLEARVMTRVKTAVRGALTTTRKSGGATVQTTAAASTTSGKAGSDASGSSASAKDSNGTTPATSGGSSPTGGGTPGGDTNSPTPSDGDGSPSGSPTSEQPSGTPSEPASESPAEPSPTPTPTPTETTAVLSQDGAAYYLNGKLLAVDTAAAAAGDFDGNGAVGTNGQELTGLVGQSVTMVVVELADGTLGIYSINGISFG